MRSIRSLSDKPVRQKIVIDIAVDKIVKLETERAHLTEDEQKAEAERVRKLLERVCAMNDADFELNKDKLAEELINGSAYEKLKILQKEKEKIGAEIQKIGKERRLRESDSIVKYFLNPIIVEPILKERLNIKEEEKSEEEREKPQQKGS
jgi:hypothetical protein